MNVGQILSLAAEHHPDKSAFIWGDQVTSYSRANTRAAALAAGLCELGLEPGERVGILMWNCPQLLESFFATWKAGGCIVPLNARLVADEVVYHLGDPRATTVVFGEEFREMMAQIRDRLPSVRHFICTGKP